MFKTFDSYISEVVDAVQTKGPELVEQLIKVVETSQTVADTAPEQIKGLDPFAAVKATKNLAVNMKQVPSLPGLVKDALKELADELQQVKECIEDIQKNMDNYKKHGETCAKQKLSKPIQCYFHVYGPITAEKK